MCTLRALQCFSCESRAVKRLSVKSTEGAMKEYPWTERGRDTHHGLLAAHPEDILVFGGRLSRGVHRCQLSELS